MKITSIEVFGKDLSYVDSVYRWGAGNRISVAGSSVVMIGTNARLIGCGEFCSCGENDKEATSHDVEAADCLGRSCDPNSKQLARRWQARERTVR